MHVADYQVHKTLMPHHMSDVQNIELSSTIAFEDVRLWTTCDGLMEKRAGEGRDGMEGLWGQGSRCIDCDLVGKA